MFHWVSNRVTNESRPRCPEKWPLLSERRGRLEWYCAPEYGTSGLSQQNTALLPVWMGCGLSDLQLHSLRSNKKVVANFCTSSFRRAIKIIFTSYPIIFPPKSPLRGHQVMYKVLRLDLFNWIVLFEVILVFWGEASAGGCWKKGCSVRSQNVGWLNVKDVHSPHFPPHAETFLYKHSV